ncbi:MAG: hypothetical protein WCG78_05235, partial [Candidatus Omnitrophota bacterium]
MIHTTKNLIAALLIVMFAGDRAAAGSQMTALRPRASAERTAPEVDIRPVREVQRFIPAGTSLKASEVLPSGVPFGLCVSITVKDPAGEVVQRHDLQ